MEIALRAAPAILATVIGTIVLEWLPGRRLERYFAEERLRTLPGLGAELAENRVLDTSGSWRKAPFATDNKADVNHQTPECPLIAISGHFPEPWMPKMRPSDGCKGDAVFLTVE